jgi:4-aminobutyrate aminotransferase
VAAAHAVLNIIDNESLCARARHLGDRLSATLEEIQGTFPALVAIREEDR